MGDIIETTPLPKDAVFCPWGFLDGISDKETDNEPLNASLNATTTGEVQNIQSTGVHGKKTYANVTRTTYGRDVDTATLPTPGRQGEYPTISIQTDDVDKGLEYCKLGLVGRLDMSKLNMYDVNNKVKELWKPKSEWQATPLGKGYIMFCFTDETDYQRVWTQGTWVFDEQVLRLSKWTPNFSTSKENHLNGLVWIRFPGLSLEYWELKTLFSLGRAVGRPIHTDENTAKRKLGYYASVLVDVDLTQKIPEKIWVEVSGRDIKILKEDLNKNKEKEKEKEQVGRREDATSGMSKNQRRKQRKKDKENAIVENTEQGKVQASDGEHLPEINIVSDAQGEPIEIVDDKGQTSESQAQWVTTDAQNENQEVQQEPLNENQESTTVAQNETLNEAQQDPKETEVQIPKETHAENQKETQVMKRLRFSDTWIKWITKIVNLAYISILLNGGPVGYFAMKKGLKQGDPLSPLLFTLAEDTLSRELLYLRTKKHLMPLTTIKSVEAPSHLLFVDDIIIFANGGIKGIRKLNHVLGRYVSTLTK
ncbi:hypothetical protein IFM89_028959 [Coptis chinensis]|uniref:DUF4283 domain-containing protein n=1 Tax=Coptis chinensis TaxID=261450 RepID=A0A835II80_9MAGN|nr:hypothetical protein IFM89_028959 [Coptis chinensis]